MILTGVNNESAMELDNIEWMSILEIIESIHGEAILGTDMFRNIKMSLGFPLQGDPLDKLGNAIEQFIEDNEMDRVQIGYFNSISIEKVKEFVSFIRENRTLTAR